MQERKFISPTGKRLVRRRSRITGWGVYAAQRITKNSRVIDYAGEKITTDEADRRETRYQRQGNGDRSHHYGANMQQTGQGLPLP